MGAAIEQTPRAPRDREWKGVAALLIGDAEIAARLSPLRSVWRDAAPFRAEVSQQMRELVPQRAIDLFCAVVA
jgi:hypothetical protein